MCTVRLLGSLSSLNKADWGSLASLLFLLLLAMVVRREVGRGGWSLGSGVCSSDLVITLPAATMLWVSLSCGCWSLSEEAARVRSRGETCTSSWWSSVSTLCMAEAAGTSSIAILQCKKEFIRGSHHYSEPFDVDASNIKIMLVVDMITGWKNFIFNAVGCELHFGRTKMPMLWYGLGQRWLNFQCPPGIWALALLQHLWRKCPCALWSVSTCLFTELHCITSGCVAHHLHGKLLHIMHRVKYTYGH